MPVPLTRRGERGAAAVEAALVTPVFILLLVGIIEFGMFFKDYLSVASAVRAGVRTASAEPRMTTYAQDTVASVAAEGTALARGNIQELWVYRANATNKYPDGKSDFASGCSACVKFRWNGTAFEQISSTWAAANQKACAAGPIDRVGVFVKYRHNSFTRLIFDSFTIEESTAMRFEPKPTTQGCQ